jgi:Tol biopolymer transport system component
MAFHVVSAEGGDTQQLDQGSPYYYAWSPEGDRLLVHTGQGASNQVKFLPVKEEVPESIIPTTPSFFQAPAWSSDGEKIYAAFDDLEVGSSIIEADPAGANPRTLANIEGPVAFAIDHAGERMAYFSEARTSPIGFLGRVRVIDMDTPDDILETEEDLVMSFFWSPDGGKLAYFVPQLLDPASLGMSGSDPIPGLTLRILDMETEVSSLVASFRPTDDFLSIMPYFDQYHHSATIWSPDSRNLVLSALVQDDQPAIVVVPSSEGRSVRYLDSGVLAFWSWD